MLNYSFQPHQHPRFRPTSKVKYHSSSINLLAFLMGLVYNETMQWNGGIDTRIIPSKYNELWRCFQWFLSPENVCVNKRRTMRWNTDVQFCIQWNFVYALPATCLLRYTRPKCDFRRWYAYSCDMHITFKLVNTPETNWCCFPTSLYKIMEILMN